MYCLFHGQIGMLNSEVGGSSVICQGPWRAPLLCLGEVPMTLVAAVLVDRLGRRLTIVTGLLLTGKHLGPWHSTAPRLSSRQLALLAHPPTKPCSCCNLTGIDSTSGILCVLACLIMAGCKLLAWSCSVLHSTDGCC